MTRARRALTGCALGAFATVLSSSAESTLGAAPASSEPGPTAELQARRAELEDALTHLEEVSHRRSRAYVRSLRAGLLPLSGGFDALLSHAVGLQRRRQSLVRLFRRRATLAEELARVTEAVLEAERKAPQQARAVRAQRALRAEEEREAAFRQAFSGNWQPAIVYGAARPTHAPEGFAKQRGRLGFPVAGRAEVEAVESPTGHGLALRFKSAAGTRARATYAGRVAFADEYPGLGRTVILEHGDQYYSVTARLATIAVAVGQELATGDVLGTMSTRKGRGEALVEIRREGEVEEPHAWFGLRKYGPKR